MPLQEISGAQHRRPARLSVPDDLRNRLLAGVGMWQTQLAHDTAKLDLLTAYPGDDPTGVERATTALHMYGAVEAIEEFADALVRVEDGSYGTCQSCGRPIPIERLEVNPQARSCAACPTAADRRLRSRRPRGQPEPHDGWPARVNRPTWRAAVDSGVLAESTARHSSSLRREHVLEDPAPR